MDFNSLGQGSPFYIIQKSDKPTLQVGLVKSKSNPKPQYQAQTPGVFTGTITTNVVDVVVTVGGNDVPFSNLPVGSDHSTYNNGNTYVSCNREATLQEVDTMIQASKKALEQEDYHKLVISEGEKMLEVLNPRYAEEKQRDRTINELVEHRKETDSKLDKILAFMQELTSPSKVKS